MNDSCVLLTLNGPSTVIVQSENLGVGYLVTALRQSGYAARGLHVSTMNLDVRCLVHQIISRNPRFVGISVFTESWLDCVEVIRDLKRTRPEVHLCLGGHLPSFSWRQILADYQGVDSIVIGEGDLTIPELIERIYSGATLEGCRGVAFRDRGQPVANALRPPVEDLDRLPFPARDQLWELGNTSARIITSRGCTGRCSFCSVPAFRRLQRCRAWRGRSPENIVDEIEQLTAEGIRSFSFEDSSFEDPRDLGKSRLRKLAMEILNRGLNIDFYGWARVGSFTEDDIPLLRLLQKAGLERIFIGMESVLPQELEVYRKRHCEADGLAIHQLINKVGIPHWFGFILFSPYGSMEGIRNAVNFIAKVKQAYLWNQFRSRLLVFSGAEIESILRQDSLLDPEYRFWTQEAYRFLDTKVEAMYHSLRDLGCNEIDEIDSDLLGLTLVTGKNSWRRSVTAKGLARQGQELNRLVAAVRSGASEHNLKVMRQALILGEAGKLPKQVPILRDLLMDAGYLAAQRKHLDQCRSAYRELAERIHAA